MRADYSGLPFALRVRVYFEDTDAGGIVYYVNYLKFMERARTELVRSLGFDQSVLQVENIIFVVHSVTARYHAPARLDDELEVNVEVLELKRASIRFRQQVRRVGAPRGIPPALATAFKALQVTDSRTKQGEVERAS